MESLVSLAVARAHLNDPPVDRNDKVWQKACQASAVILEYLKGRAHEAQATAVVESSSTDDPTVITTQSPHGLTNGQTVFISGHVDSVPSINGLWVVDDVTADTFTIPVAVTVEGTGGRVSLTWTQATVPGQVQASVLLLMAHLYDHAGDDMTADEKTWQAIERLLMRSRDPALV